MSSSGDVNSVQWVWHWAKAQALNLSLFLHLAWGYRASLHVVLCCPGLIPCPENFVWCQSVFLWHIQYLYTLTMALKRRQPHKRNETLSIFFCILWLALPNVTYSWGQSTEHSEQGQTWRYSDEMILGSAETVWGIPNVIHSNWVIITTDDLWTVLQIGQTMEEVYRSVSLNDEMPYSPPNSYRILTKS